MQAPEVLSHSPLFKGVGHAPLKLWAHAFLRESWTKGQLVADRAECARSFRVIVRGRVKIVRTNADDAREVTLWLLGPGDGFDVVSLLDGEPHAVAAWALDDVETLAVPLRTMQQWLDRSAPLRLAMHRYVAHQLRALTDLAGDLALHDTMTRLAGLLLRHANIAGTGHRAASSLISDLSHEELASLIGSVRVVVSRLLAELKREGVVELRSGTIRVLDLKRLLQRAENQARRNGRQLHGSDDRAAT
jgi:CRP-like cAMP-binding protein